MTFHNELDCTSARDVLAFVFVPLLVASDRSETVRLLDAAVIEPAQRRAITAWQRSMRGRR